MFDSQVLAAQIAAQMAQQQQVAPKQFVPAERTTPLWQPQAAMAGPQGAPVRSTPLYLPQPVYQRPTPAQAAPVARPGSTPTPAQVIVGMRQRKANRGAQPPAP